VKPAATTPRRARTCNLRFR